VPLGVDLVLDYLRPFPATVMQAYLEFIIGKGENGESFHTKLGLIYVDTLLHLLPPELPQALEMLSKGDGGGLLGSTRGKLRQFLATSKYPAIRLFELSR
jgi:hypothetical protein